MSQRRTEGQAWSTRIGERWSAADGEAMLAALSASGESDAAFSRRTGVAPHRIQYWRKKLDAEAPRSDARERTVAGFVPVRVVPSSPAPQPVYATRQVEATLRSGTRLVFSGEWDRDGLRPWLDALEAHDAE